jgi:hypothetical protein
MVVFTITRLQLAVEVVAHLRKDGREITDSQLRRSRPTNSSFGCADPKNRRSHSAAHAIVSTCANWRSMASAFQSPDRFSIADAASENHGRSFRPFLSQDDAGPR